MLLNSCVSNTPFYPKVTKLQLYKIYGKGKDGKAFVEELCKGHWANKYIINFR